jgi:hypothetical protein
MDNLTNSFHLLGQISKKIMIKLLNKAHDHEIGMKLTLP